MILPRKDCGLCLNILENQGILNKSTRTFPGLYSYRPQKWHQHIQNFAMLHLRLEHFDVTCISMVDKSTDHGKLLLICFWHLFSLKFLAKLDRGEGEKQNNCATFMSFPWLVHFYQALLSTKQHARNHSVMVKTHFDLGYGQVLWQNKIDRGGKQCYVEILTWVCISK